MGQPQKQDQKMGKNSKTAITPRRDEDFPQWYQNVIKAADLAENSPVRGCMIIKPYGYALWENIQRALDDMIKECGVQNAYFPLLIPLSFISKEAEHIDGFAKECAVVTHHRLEKGEDGGLVPAAPLQEPLVVRPTSETIIGETLSNWINSYRDLPCKLNQWCNVMRWEMRPRMFLRTSEFLWQEGHNCFATAEEAREDAYKMCDVYADLAENYLAMPVIKGEKTPDERFPGAIATYTIEAMMQDGKALQAGTSHDLGQTFSKSTEIKYQGQDGGEHYAWTTSWGMSTRTIGGIIMTHSDDDGFIVPPRVAPQQIVIIPVLRGDEGTDKIMAHCQKLAAQLKGKGIRAYVNDRDDRTPDKMWDAIKKGIPVRVEIGLREVEADSLTSVRRDLGRDSKATLTVSEFVGKAQEMLDDIQANLFNAANERMRANIVDIKTLDEMREFFASDRIGFTRSPVDLINDPEFEKIKGKFAVTPRCIPFEDEGQTVLVGRSY